MAYAPLRSEGQAKGLWVMRDSTVRYAHFIFDHHHVTSVTASEIGNFLRKVILCIVLDLLNQFLDLAFVDKYVRHVNQLLFCKKVNICSRRSQNSE